MEAGPSKRKYKKRKLMPPSKCSICLELIVYSKDLYFITCGHYYHEGCINKWLEKKVTCPICRIPIFIQDFDQLEKYREFLSQQKINLDLRRRNLPTDDNAIALMFLRDKHLFQKSIVELEDTNCYSHLMQLPEEPSFEELYGNSFDSEEESNIPPPPPQPPIPSLLSYQPSNIPNDLINISRYNRINVSDYNNINIIRHYDNPFDINFDNYNPIIRQNNMVRVMRNPVQILRRNTLDIINSSNNSISSSTNNPQEADLSQSSSSYNTLFNSREIVEHRIIIQSSENRVTIPSTTSISTMTRLLIEYPNNQENITNINTYPNTEHNNSTQQHLENLESLENLETQESAESIENLDNIIEGAEDNTQQNIIENDEENIIENDESSQNENPPEENTSEEQIIEYNLNSLNNLDETIEDLSSIYSRTSEENRGEYDRDEFEKYARYEHLYETFNESESEEDFNGYENYEDYRIYHDNLENIDEENIDENNGSEDNFESLSPRQY